VLSFDRLFEQMSPLLLAILLFASGVILLLAEVVLPSHGVLGLLGAGALIGGVVACFWMNQYAGLAAAILLVFAAPFAAMLWVKVWPHTYAGRRLILGRTASSTAPAPPVQVGQLGIVVSELRPGGVCEFGMNRVEARCEHGTIPAGRHVEIVAVVDHRPLVRAI
jgi:membrane-bound serine protease (ClpP class)